MEKMKQTEARNGRKKIAQGKRRENERRPGFNKQNKILPLLAERGEGRGEESKNPGTCRAAAHGVISSRQSMSPELFNELRKLRNEVAHGMQNPDASELVKRLEKLGLTVSIASRAEITVELPGTGCECFVSDITFGSGKKFQQQTSKSIYENHARNVIPGKITNIKKGPITALVTLEIAPGIKIVSSITSGSANDLKLKKGQSAYAIIKASSVMIGAD
jgi:molybdopterin-binding protein